ncbi:MAG: phage tail tape measure protein [Planktomarina sp.]
MATYDDFQSQMDAFEASLGGASTMVSGFNEEMERLQQTTSRTQYDISTLEKGLSRGLRSAIDGVVLDGKTLGDGLRSLSQSMINAAYNAALKPVTAHFGGLMAQGVNGLMNAVMPFAAGGVMSQGRVTAFAKGGVVGGPMTFPMRGGTGLMGEAGPEAIMPLTRGPDGRLGVAANGRGGGVHVTMNITTPDAASFQRSQSQIAASMQRALGRGGRNV